MTRLVPYQCAALAADIDRIIESHASSAARLPRKGEEIDAKESANRHAAARAALSHLDHLLKMIASGAPGDERPSAGEVLASARAEIGEDTAPEETPEADDAGQPG